MMRKPNITVHQEVARARAKVRGLTPAKAAAKLRARAEAYVRHNRKRFANDRINLRQIEMDYIALKRIASTIRAGDLSGAYRQTGLTFAVDDIPLDVWLYIGGAAPTRLRHEED